MTDTQAADGKLTKNILLVNLHGGDHDKQFFGAVVHRLETHPRINFKVTQYDAASREPCPVLERMKSEASSVIVFCNADSDPGTVDFMREIAQQAPTGVSLFVHSAMQTRAALLKINSGVSRGVRHSRLEVVDLSAPNKHSSRAERLVCEIAETVAREPEAAGRARTGDYGWTSP